MSFFFFTTLLLLQNHLIFGFRNFVANQKFISNHHEQEYAPHIPRDKFEEPEEWEKMAITDALNDYRHDIGEETLEIILSSTITVNVHFNIIHRPNGYGNVTNHNIAQQIDVLNEAFSGITKCMTIGCSGSTFEHGETINTPFHFELAEINRIEDTKAFNLDSSESVDLQKALRKGTCADMYIFTGKSEYLGAAMYASKCPSFNNIYNPNNLDSILLDFRTLPGGGHTKYQQGKTLVHEVGHWLGLFHTFEGGCDENGDSVSDTPPEESPNFGCQVGRKSCSYDESDSVHNFMSYSDDCCMYHFTQGQTERMVLEAGHYRGLMPDLNETLAPSASVAPSSSVTPSPSVTPSTSIAPSAPSTRKGVMAHDDAFVSLDLLHSAQKVFDGVMNRLNF